MSYEVETIDFRDGVGTAAAATSVSDDEVQITFDIDMSGSADGYVLTSSGGVPTWADSGSIVDRMFSYMMGGA
jgi:hypothetical protein